MTFSLILTLMSAATLAHQDPCEAVEADIERTHATLDEAALRPAQRTAEAIIERAPQCADAHVLLANVLQRRLDQDSGLSAMGHARRFRRSIADALEIDPDHVQARQLEIGYLIHAPGIAGGDREEALARIESLRPLDGLAAAQMDVELARATGSDTEIIDALQSALALDPGQNWFRSELTRRLLRAERYTEAQEALLPWQDGPDGIAGERDFLAGALLVVSAGDQAEAERLLLSALEAECDITVVRCINGATTHALIGQARETLGALDAAREAYRAALEIDPENERALSGLERLNAAE